MSFLFIDRILSLVPNERVVGIKHVTADDRYLMPGRDGRYALLPCIIGETLGQLAAWNVMFASDFTLRPVAGVAGCVSILDDVYLGDTLHCESVIDDVDGSAVRYHSVGRVNGKTVFTLEDAIGPFLPIQDLSDSALVKKQFEQIFRPGESAELPIPIASLAQNAHHLEPIQYDHVLEEDIGKSIVAVKHVSKSAPYFPDHFPNKPVLPMTILLQCKLALAQHFLANFMGPEEAETYFPTAVRKLKMKSFIQPGDSVVSTLILTSQTESQCIFQLSSVVDGKRVFVGEAELTKVKHD